MYEIISTFLRKIRLSILLKNPNIDYMKNNSNDKVYCTNQGCNGITVYDGKTNKKIETIQLGLSPKL